jgi:hypothetical protein
MFLLGERAFCMLCSSEGLRPRLCHACERGRVTRGARATLRLRLRRAGAGAKLRKSCRRAPTRGTRTRRGYFPHAAAHRATDQARGCGRRNRVCRWAADVQANRKKSACRRGHARKDDHHPGRKDNAIEMARDGDPRPALVLALHDKPQVARQFAIGAAKSGLKNAKADRFQSILFDPAYLIRQDGARV